MRKRALVSRTLSSTVSTRCLVQAKLISPSQVFIHPVLMDSGADKSFMDWRLVKRLGLNLLPLLKPLEVSSLDGRLLCKVTHHTQPIQLIMARDHRESLSFHLFDSPSPPLLLGLPWLILTSTGCLGRFWAEARIVHWPASLQRLFLHLDLLLFVCLHRTQTSQMMVVPRTSCLFLSHSTFRSSTGPTPPSCHVIRGSKEPASSPANNSGGL